MKTTLLISLLLLFCTAGCHYSGKQEAILRAKSISQDRLELLFNQVVEVRRNSEYEAIFNKLSPEGIPSQFKDLGVRKIHISGDHAYLSFWFCMDEGVQYDVVGLEGEEPPKIELSWGGPCSSSYTVETIWEKNTNESPQKTDTSTPSPAL